MKSQVDLVLVNPGNAKVIYQGLGTGLTAIEPPLWCRLIGGYLRDRGVRIEIIDAEARGLSPDAVAEEISSLRPKLVAMVVYGHQPSASTQQMSGAGAACRAIKARVASPPIIIIGGHVAALPERTLTEEAVDFACNSEGPVTVHYLLEALSQPKPDFDDVPGLVWFRGNSIISNPSPPLIKDLDADLHGDVWDLLDMPLYRAHNWQCFGALETRQPYASIYTSLGCPYRCTFCCINAPFGVNRYRMRKPELVVAEIVKLHDLYGVKTFKIVDEMFVLNERHVLAICDGLIASGLDLNIWAYARIDTVKPHMLDRLRRAGIRWLALGIESGSVHVRDGADKSFNQVEIVEIVRAIQAADINVIGNYIFGLPDDDHASMQETLDLALELNCEFGNFYSAMAYPGSALYAMAIERGWELPSQWSGYSQHSYDCLPLPTDKLGAADVLRFRDEAFHQYFSAPAYLTMVEKRFGAETAAHVRDMAQHRLKRQILTSADTALVDVAVANEERRMSL
jgi:radical SAM superfamily enzyme YgiQ (UPF0313 family)